MAVELEPWVGAKEVGRHIGYSERHVLNLTRQGLIPAMNFSNGRRHVYRYKLSLVDSALTQRIENVA